MTAEKKEIRKQVLAERRALDEETVELASQVICRKILDLDLYENADNLCLYMPINNEVNVMLLADAAAADGKKIWLPKVLQKHKNGQAGVMNFNIYRGPESMEEGEYGIMESGSREFLFNEEPRSVSGAEADVTMKAGENTLIIIPGAAFTPWKDRIGYGGGFYDRFLAEHPECGTIGVCYDFQIVPELPTEESDMKPDCVVSETSIYR